MKKEDKAAIVRDLGRLFETNETFYLVDFKRMTVAQAVELRKLLRKSGYTYRVVKNRLALRALGDRCPEAVRPFFQKPTAVAFAAQDPIPLARVLKDFSAQGKVLAVKAGVVEGQVLPAGGFDELCKLTSKKDLFARFGALMAAPLHRLLRTLRAPLGHTAVLLGELQRTRKE